MSQRRYKLLGKHGQRNLADHVGRKRHARPLFLPLQDADDHSLQQSVLVRETAREKRPCENCRSARNRPAFAR
jgi:hypothetical protein